MQTTFLEPAPRYACEFSACRRYRYTLLDVWDARKPRVMFIGLNPSTADEYKLDPTLKRIREWSEKWGFGSFVMTNLFAFRSPHPTVMEAQEDPVGPGNDQWLIESAELSNQVVAAWGNGGAYRDRAKAVCTLFRDVPLYCLGTTDSGAPTHPMARGKHRVPDNIQLRPWR